MFGFRSCGLAARGSSSKVESVREAKGGEKGARQAVAVGRKVDAQARPKGDYPAIRSEALRPRRTELRQGKTEQRHARGLKLNALSLPR